MHDPGALVASAFLAAAERDGLTPDPALRLLRLRDDRTAPETIPDGPFELGPLHERLVAAADRVQRGAWYTPRWLAEDLVARATRTVDPRRHRPIRVADPACGGGVFLLAAAEHLAGDHAAGAVVDSLWGCDIDPVAVAVTEAALWWWSARRGEAVVGGDRLVVGDALTTTNIPTADVVVGNPPFLGQLRTTTASDQERRAALRRRFGDALRPYTDAAWLFLLAAVDAVDDGGAVALVQPSSLLGARDADAVRARIDGKAALVETWLDDGSAFSTASVEACAPVLRIGAAAANDWTAALSDARRVPPVQLRGAGTLGRVADVVAGFRDEYYGLVDAVREGGDGRSLVTSGAIDPLRLRSGVTTRFAKHRWHRPTVDAAGVTGRAARWLECQERPKLLVATQTRVLEAAVDERGDLAGSVPVIVVAPHEPEMLWKLAAAVHAPVVSAWMMRRSAGTALSNDACKPTAGLLSDLPLPVDDVAWNDAADLARAIASGADHWQAFAVAADRAHGVDDEAVRTWWLARLPVR